VKIPGCHIEIKGQQQLMVSI